MNKTDFSFLVASLKPSPLMSHLHFKKASKKKKQITLRPGDQAVDLGIIVFCWFQRDLPRISEEVSAQGNKR